MISKHICAIEIDKYVIYFLTSPKQNSITKTEIFRDSTYFDMGSLEDLPENEFYIENRTEYVINNRTYTTYYKYCDYIILFEFDKDEVIIDAIIEDITNLNLYSNLEFIETL